MSKDQSAKTEGDRALVLVFGDDDFEVRARSKAILENWLKKETDVEPEIVDGNASNVSEVASVIRSLKLSLETLSLFGSGKIVWFRNCNFLSSEGRLALASSTAEEVESLLEILKRLDWTQTRLLISCTAVDKRKRFYKWIQKAGTVVGCESLAAQGDQGEVLAARLVQGQISESGKRVTHEVVDHLVQCVGLDRRALVSECEKAILHSGNGTEVTREDVEATVTKSRQAKAFAFADAVAERKLADSLVRLDEELWSMRTDRQKSEMGLLYGLISKFRNLLMVKDLVVRGKLREERNYNSVRSQLSALNDGEFPGDRRFNPKSQNPYVIFRALAQVRNYRQSELVAALAILMGCNMRLITVSDRPGSLLRDCVISIIVGPKI